MSSYREHSFDPNGGSTDSRPMRPFNWVQWIGAGLVVAGVAVIVGAFLSRLGWVAPEVHDWLTSGTAFCVLGTVLINSRRESISLTSESKRRRLIIVAVALAVCALTAAIIFYFKGA